MIVIVVAVAVVVVVVEWLNYSVREADLSEFVR